jgi:hypothetical protein
VNVLRFPIQTREIWISVKINETESPTVSSGSFKEFGGWQPSLWTGYEHGSANAVSPWTPSLKKRVLTRAISGDTSPISNAHESTSYHHCERSWVSPQPPCSSNWESCRNGKRGNRSHWRGCKGLTRRGRCVCIPDSSIQDQRNAAQTRGPIKKVRQKS